ncbi:helix-turn-helix transcriptional regulator [Nocardioides terrisoli]|uniref:helix-turn-helix transcriptional regulator n=1 Tax=Nocardioides terrisoli TaxID=3388267 RepID=UPI00287BC7E4|nr:WYL domain-containing protein [Nocardioides marmorisolisilvae]
MAAPPKYVQRIARLPEVFEVLAAHPDGLPIADVARELGVPAEELREDLLAFYSADVGTLLLGLSRPDVLEFLGTDGDDDPATAEVVRIVDQRPIDELGVEYVDAAELALVYTAARGLLELDPDDEDLKGALSVLTETMLGDPVRPRPPASWNRPLEALEDAVTDHRRVRIVYSRTWHEGVTDRVIEPYLLVQTRRGWEVDAGPPDAGGRLRTFLVSNIRDYEVLDEEFTAPPELDRLLEAQRATTRVRVRIPHAARWATDFYAERVAIIADDELSATLDLDLLPPVEQRIGLLLLIAGTDAAVLDPTRLVTAGPNLAAELLAHHRGHSA